MEKNENKGKCHQHTDMKTSLFVVSASAGFLSGTKNLAEQKMSSWKVFPWVRKGGSRRVLSGLVWGGWVENAALCVRQGV